MEIEACLKAEIRPGRKVAVLGIGSTLRSDDAAGMYFVELLGRRVQKENVLLLAGSTAPENFTGVLKNFAPEILFIVDAAYMGLSPGETGLVPAADIGGVSFSTHMLPLPIMLEYLRSEMSLAVVFIGIQPFCTEQGFAMGDAVKQGTERLVELFAGYL